MVARILVVEDHAHSLTLMLYLLKARGYSTLFATDSDQAVQLAREEEPDLIVCGLEGPGEDTQPMAHRLHQEDRLRGIPMLAVADTTPFEMGWRNGQAPVGDVYAKPINPDTFVKAVESRLPPELRASHQPVRPRGQRRKSDPQ